MRAGQANGGMRVSDNGFWVGNLFSQLDPASVCRVSDPAPPKAREALSASEMSNRHPQPSVRPIAA